MTLIGPGMLWIRSRGRGIFCILILLVLVGCHGPSIENADTPTPRPPKADRFVL